jgi:hypothetical protein
MEDVFVHTIVSEWVESHFPLYRAVSVHSLYGTSNLPVYAMNESTAVLIAIVRGKGMLSINEQAFDLREGSVVLLPAHTDATLISDSVQPLHAYKLLLGIQEPTESHSTGTMMRRSGVVSGSNVSFLSHEPVIVAQVEELYLHRSPGSEARHVQNQIVFHQIILQLLEHQNNKYDAGEQPSMERSIAYLENHYTQKSHGSSWQQWRASVRHTTPSCLSRLPVFLPKNTCPGYVSIGRWSC